MKPIDLESNVLPIVTLYALAGMRYYPSDDPSTSYSYNTKESFLARGNSSEDFNRKAQHNYSQRASNQRRGR